MVIAVQARTDFTDTQSVFANFLPFGSIIAITAASLIQLTDIAGLAVVAVGVLISQMQINDSS